MITNPVDTFAWGPIDEQACYQSLAPTIIEVFIWRKRGANSLVLTDTQMPWVGHLMGHREDSTWEQGRKVSDKDNQSILIGIINLLQKLSFDDKEADELSNSSHHSPCFPTFSPAADSLIIPSLNKASVCLFVGLVWGIVSFNQTHILFVK